jgi:hypothetical protein
MPLPATGAELSFARVNRAFTNCAIGAAGNAPAGGQNIRLSYILGACATYGISQTAGTQISFSSKFGGRPNPYTY